MSSQEDDEFSSDDSAEQFEEVIPEQEIQRVGALRREQDEYLVKLSCEKPIIKKKVQMEHSDQITQILDEVEEEMDELIHQVRKFVQFVTKQQEKEHFNIIQKHLNIQPSILKKGQLPPYQLEGVNWIISMYEVGMNGILADQMGLGKTIQTIAFLAFLKQFQNISGPHLVIGPLSTIGNWEREFTQWLPECRIIKMLATQDWREQNNKNLIPNSFDVIITSYQSILNNEFQLKKFNFHCLIIDEAHKLKNEESLFVNRLKRQKSKFKLLLTGTPIQNNPHELWSLLNYLMPQLFPSSEMFDKWFYLNKNISEQGENKEVYQKRNLNITEKVKKIISLFMLRRTKAEVALEIPPKKEIHIYVQMTPLQRTQYKHLIINKKLVGVQKHRKFENLLMHLRKVCLHLYMFPELEDKNLPQYGDHLIEASGKFKVLDMFLKKLKSEDHKVIIFSQFTSLLNILEDYLVFREYNYRRIDGDTSVEEREENINEFQKEGSDIFIFMLSTRAGGLGITLTAADTVIIYDSDFNPQIDLQAMDRAHRIGQKKSVMVYRLICKSTVEEKIIERQQIKLRWEQMVIDRGLSVLFMKESSDEYKTITKFGASQILKDEPYTEEDIETLLKRGEELTRQLNEQIDRKFKVIQEEITNNLDLGVKSIKINDFFKDQDNEMDISEIIQGYQLESKEESKQKVSQKFSIRRKIIQIEEFKLYQNPELLLKLLQRQNDCEQYHELQDEEIHFDIPLEIEPLTAIESETLEKLQNSGFNWDLRDFKKFIKACTLYGRSDIANIANHVGKSQEEIGSYLKQFNNRYTEIKGHEKFMKDIDLKEKALKKIEEINNLLCIYMKFHEDPFQDIDLKISYEGTPWTQEEDVLILYSTFLEGYGEWEKILSYIMDHDYSKFDYQLRTLTVRKLKERFAVILRQVEKWMKIHTESEKERELKEKEKEQQIKEEEQKEPEQKNKKKSKQKSKGRQRSMQQSDSKMVNKVKSKSQLNKSIPKKK